MGAWERVRWSPALPTPPRCASCLANLPAVSWQPGLTRPQDAQVQPRFGALCSSWVKGSRVIAPALATGTQQAAQSRAARALVAARTSAALTRPRRSPGSRPCQLEKLAFQTFSLQLPSRPAPSRRPHGGGRAPPVPAPRCPPPSRARPDPTSRVAPLRSPETHWGRRAAPGRHGTKLGGAGVPQARPVEGAGIGGSEWPLGRAVP